jgi:hypothetical protein
MMPYRIVTASGSVRIRSHGLRTAMPIPPVKFIDNPKHRRSKLVQLTAKGDARYHELNAKLLAIASTMGVALSEADIRKATDIVMHLSDDVKTRSGRLL